ncbi:hypothetical protein J3Q64DRAFT_1840374 [Phycomyces blakesleeanus]|uniref:Uncharacterized protein n=1 Tax=Phycomyces blakesleeanus TaxID=4837 RepID=A0ABR3ANB3_PHYBL
MFWTPRRLPHPIQPSITSVHPSITLQRASKYHLPSSFFTKGMSPLYGPWAGAGVFLSPTIVLSRSLAFYLKKSVLVRQTWLGFFTGLH